MFFILKQLHYGTIEFNDVHIVNYINLVYWIQVISNQNWLKLRTESKLNLVCAGLATGHKLAIIFRTPEIIMPPHSCCVPCRWLNTIVTYILDKCLKMICTRSDRLKTRPAEVHCTLLLSIYLSYVTSAYSWTRLESTFRGETTARFEAAEWPFNTLVICQAIL